MDKEVIGKEEVTPEFENEEFTLEVVEEGATETQTDEEKLALEAKIAEMEAENAKYKAQMDELSKASPPRESVSAIAEELRKLAQPAPAKPEETQTDFKKLFEDVDKNFYTSPSKSVVDVVTPIVQSMDKKYTDVIAKQALNISKLTVLYDESSKGDYIKYKDEVESIVSSLPPSESVYAEALKTVRANHFDDILAEKVQAQVEAMAQKAEQNVQQQQAATPQFTNAAQVQQARAKNVMRITPNQEAAARKWAMIKGYDWSDPAEKEWVLKYLKGNGSI